jgi:hypothetical protein
MDSIIWIPKKLPGRFVISSLSWCFLRWFILARLLVFDMSTVWNIQHSSLGPELLFPVTWKYSVQLTDGEELTPGRTCHRKGYSHGNFLNLYLARSNDKKSSETSVSHNAASSIRILFERSKSNEDYLADINLSNKLVCSPKGYLVWTSTCVYL